LASKEASKSEEKQMANRNFQTIQALQRGLKIISGSFAPNGSGTIASTSNQGIGWSVVRTSQGLYTVTLQDAYVALVCVKASLQLASAAARYIQIGSCDVISAKTIEIRVIDASGAVQDVSANANNRVNFELTLANSTVS
jgi:hypothetical protein